MKYFINEANIKIPAVTSKQMIEVDRIAVEETGPNLFQMMENAGRNLALATFDLLGDKWKEANVIILSGTGGNGGGGICAARHLANRNINVTLCISNIEKLGTVPSFQRKIYKSTPGKEIEIDDLEFLKPDLIIDSIIGYSLNSTPKGNAKRMITWANKQNVKILSLDVPSGVNSTSGKIYGEFIKADRTLTLALPKTGLIAKQTGELFLADIGIPQAVYNKIGIDYVEPFGENYVIKITLDK